jgi:hypothetical protein
MYTNSHLTTIILIIIILILLLRFTPTLQHIHTTPAMIQLQHIP